MTRKQFKKRRLALELSQSETARLMLVKTQTISLWEREQRAMPAYMGLLAEYVFNDKAAIRGVKKP